jgi:hypothetical protein
VSIFSAMTIYEYVWEQMLQIILWNILYVLYLTGPLWRRQSQQSFNTLTPFNFLFYSLHVSAPMGHPQVRYTISYYFCFLKDYFNTTDASVLHLQHRQHTNYEEGHRATQKD